MIGACAEGDAAVGGDVGDDLSGDLFAGGVGETGESPGVLELVFVGSDRLGVTGERFQPLFERAVLGGEGASASDAGEEVGGAVAGCVAEGNGPVEAALDNECDRVEPSCRPCGVLPRSEENPCDEE